MRHIFTICDYAYLDRALVLAKSVELHEPGVRFTVALLQDHKDLHARASQQSGADIQLVETVLARSELESLGRMSVVERATALKPMLLSRLLRSSDKVIYLDPDMKVYACLSAAWRALDSHPLVVTPHLLLPCLPRPSTIGHEVDALRFGTFNMGFIGGSHCGRGNFILEWLSRRTTAFSTEDTRQGLFTDQKWLNLATVMFPEIEVLANSGYNVASWNLHERQIEVCPRGLYTHLGDPLTIFHFSKAVDAGVKATGRSRGANAVVAGLWRDYAAELSLARRQLWEECETDDRNCE